MIRDFMKETRSAGIRSGTGLGGEPATIRSKVTSFVVGMPSLVLFLVRWVRETENRGRCSVR
jgi:hypothetical protein